MPITFKIILPILATVLFTVALLFMSNVGSKLNWVVSTSNYVNGQFKYQSLLMLVTGCSIFITYLFNKESFANYFSFGQISAVGEELKIFGINKGDNWMKTGLSLCLVISSVTAIFMYFQLKNVTIDRSILRSGICWIILFSLTNSFGEEMIYRLGIISPLQGVLPATTIFYISALLFGLPHFAGMPNGIIGATMAGVLGFVLAKSMVETNGFFWAWIIHFIQDVIIIGALFLMNSTTQNN